MNDDSRKKQLGNKTTLIIQKRFGAIILNLELFLFEIAWEMLMNEFNLCIYFKFSVKPLKIVLSIGIVDQMIKLKLG